MGHKEQINLVWAPFGYAYSVPLSSGYLKANLLSNGYENVKVVDLNQDFWNRNREQLGNGVTPFEERYQSILQNVINWNNIENFKEHIQKIPEIQELIYEYAETLLSNSPKIIGFTIFNTNLFFTLEVLKVIKKLKSEVKILLGGPEATASYYNEVHTLKTDSKDLWNVVVFGEGDETIVEVCNTILTKEYDYKSIDGIYYYDGEIKINKWRKFIKNINEIPFPDYSDIDFSLYHHPELPIVLSRGCNYGCLYCGVKQYWKKASDFRTRTSTNMFDEVLHLDEAGYIKRGEFNYLSLKGAYINTNDTRLEEFCDKVIDYYDYVPFQWGGWARVDKNMTPELCKKMYDAGCHHITFGFESGSPRINKEMRKGYKNEYNNEYAANVFKNCMDAGIQTVLFIIIGYPTETDADFQATMDFLKDNDEHIDAVYCMSTFILSNPMMSDDSKFWGKTRFGIEGENPHPVEWESTTNTYETRVKRLEIFKEYAEKNDLTTISNRK
jgi:anaerobic magnesium-protoporphyrin IX monomethyl ester cyclase